MAVPTTRSPTEGIPKPTYEFFIPSIHDDTALACRVYCVPDVFAKSRRVSGAQTAVTHPWTAKGAVVAHNYTGLGGSHDNIVVLTVVGELLRAGFMVGTFNLRGAGNSKGKSTWTSKAELQDYISFVGFFLYYLSGVYPPYSVIGPFDDLSGSTPISSDLAPIRPPARLFLAGYSYGALLTKYLPHVPVILSQFSRALKTSSQAEIRRRAYRLAFITATDLPSPAYLASIEFFNPSAKQMLQEKVKDHRNELKTPFVRIQAKDSWPNQHLGGDPSDEDYTARVEVPPPITHYLLVSMLLGPAASFVTGFRKLAGGDMKTLDEKFQYNPTAIIHGDWDKITSESRLSDWLADIEDRTEGKCHVRGVHGAGHSWKEKGAMNKLRSHLRRFFEGCLEQQCEEKSPNLATIPEQEEKSETMSNT